MHTLLLIFLLTTLISSCYGQLPDSILHLSRPYALVAGGSKGIGYAIAEALARRGYNLVLIARHIDSLNAAKEKLETTYLIKADVLVYDLSKEESATEIATWCMKRNLPLKVLCNVAGLGGSNDYLTIPLHTMRYMVNLNLESCIALSMTLLPLLERNAPSYILNVGSLAGFAPIPDKNIYSATKSGVIFFSYALRYQLKEKNISVSCLNPGPVFTKPSIREDTERTLGKFGLKMAVSPSRVGEVAVKKMLRGKLMITPGTLASISASIVRTLPRKWVTAFYYRTGKKSKTEHPETESVRKK
jgi:short-subunit dehydrogenase